MTKICSAGSVISGSKDIANEFNKFFCNIGEQISNSVEPTKSQPEQYIPDTPGVVPMEFGTYTQAEFINIINNMEPKGSVDFDSIINKMIKNLKFELATPLVHIINLSFRSGSFPSKLKTSRTVPIF
jgi:hypothetical protein